MVTAAEAEEVARAIQALLKRYQLALLSITNIPSNHTIGQFKCWYGGGKRQPNTANFMTPQDKFGNGDWRTSQISLVVLPVLSHEMCSGG